MRRRRDLRLRLDRSAAQGGDAGAGSFIQLTADAADDLTIPDRAGDAAGSLSFGVLIRAQALRRPPSAARRRAARAAHRPGRRSGGRARRAGGDDPLMGAPIDRPAAGFDSGRQRRIMVIPSRSSAARTEASPPPDPSPALTGLNLVLVMASPPRSGPESRLRHSPSESQRYHPLSGKQRADRLAACRPGQSRRRRR